MLRASLALLLTLAPATLALGQARAVDEALGAYQDGELYRALELFTAALEAPGNSPEDLVNIHLHLGILKGSLADMDGARSAFESALAIDATLSAPEELNPDLGALFSEVSSGRGGRSLTLNVSAPSSVEANRPVSLAVRVNGAPAGLVASVRAGATAPGGGDAVTTEAAPLSDGAAQLTLPAAAWRGAVRLRVETRAFDSFGGIVAVAHSELEASSTTAADPAIAYDVESQDTDEGSDDGGILASPWFWIVTGVIVLGAAGAVTAVVLTTETQPVVGSPMIMALTR